MPIDARSSFSIAKYARSQKIRAFFPVQTEENPSFPCENHLQKMVATYPVPAAALTFRSACPRDRDKIQAPLGHLVPRNGVSDPTEEEFTEQ